MCNIPTVSQQVGNLEEKCIFQNSLIRWERTVSWSNHSTVPMALQYHAQTHCEYQVAVSEEQPGRRRQHDNKSPGDLRRLQIFPSYFYPLIGGPTPCWLSTGQHWVKTYLHFLIFLVTFLFQRIKSYIDFIWRVLIVNCNLLRLQGSVMWYENISNSLHWRWGVEYVL